MGKARVNGTVRKLLGALACLTLSVPWPALAESGAADEAIHDLPNPPELRGAGGELRGTLTVAPAEVTVRGRKVVANVVNGDYLAPTLRVRRGDTIRVRAVNRIGPAEVNIDGPQPRCSGTG